MSIKTKIATLAVAALAVTSLTVTAADAKPKFNPVVGAVVGTAIVAGTIAAATQPSYGYGHYPRRCYWKPQYNVFGQYVGNVRVCPVYY